MLIVHGDAYVKQQTTMQNVPMYSLYPVSPADFTYATLMFLYILPHVRVA